MTDYPRSGSRTTQDYNVGLYFLSFKMWCQNFRWCDHFLLAAVLNLIILERSGHSAFFVVIVFIFFILNIFICFSSFRSGTRRCGGWRFFTFRGREDSQSILTRSLYFRPQTKFCGWAFKVPHGIENFMQNLKIDEIKRSLKCIFFN